MSDPPQPALFTLDPVVRVILALMVTTMLVGALLTPVREERVTGYFVGTSWTEWHSITGIRFLFPGILPVSFYGLFLSGWAMLISSAVSIFHLFTNRPEGSRSAWKMSQWLLLMTAVLRGVPPLFIPDFSFTRQAELHWGASIPLWLLGQGLLFVVIWLGTRPAPELDATSKTID